MEKWKIGVIAALIACLGLYGYQQQKANSAELGQGPDAPATAVASTPAEPKPVEALRDQPAPAWKVPARYWVNTPRPITLNDLKGHVTLVEFWRTGCSHCRAAAPYLSDLYRDEGKRGLKMVSFQSPGVADDAGNPENDWTKVQGFVKEHKLPYPVAFDEGGTLFKGAYKGTNYPTLLILDRRGVVRFVQTGFDLDNDAGRAKIEEFREALDAELKKK